MLIESYVLVSIHASEMNCQTFDVSFCRQMKLQIYTFRINTYSETMRSEKVYQIEG